MLKISLFIFSKAQFSVLSAHSPTPAENFFFRTQNFLAKKSDSSRAKRELRSNTCSMMRSTSSTVQCKNWWFKWVHFPLIKYLWKLFRNYSNPKMKIATDANESLPSNELKMRETFSPKKRREENFSRSHVALLSVVADANRRRTSKGKRNRAVFHLRADPATTTQSFFRRKWKCSAPLSESCFIHKSTFQWATIWVGKKEEAGSFVVSGKKGNQSSCFDDFIPAISNSLSLFSA